jgi:flagellar L-ring protein FlgH
VLWEVKMRLRPAFLLFAFFAASPGFAEDLYKGGNWPSLAADRKPDSVGDIVTVLVAENNTASNSVGKGSRKQNSISGQITAGSSFDKSAGLTFGGSYDGEGSNSRADRMVAQLSATVTQIYPNGDLQISGWQRLKINGEMTDIKVSGRVRPDDVNGQNAVLSSRIADANIEYDGKGFATRSAKPGIVSQIFSWLGLL